MKYSALSIDVNGIMRYKHGHHLRRHVVLSRPSFLMLSRKVYSFDDAGSVLVFSLLVKVLLKFLSAMTLGWLYYKYVFLEKIILIKK